MFEQMIYIFLQSWLLGLIALILGRYVGKPGGAFFPKGGGRRFYLFVSTWFIVFLIRIAIGYVAYLLSWSDVARSGIAEFVAPLVIGGYFARTAMSNHKNGIQGIGNNKENRDSFKKIVSAMIAVAFIAIISMQVIGNKPESKLGNSKSADIKVLVSAQDSGGVSQEQLDGVFLKNYEQYAVNRIKSLTSDYLKSKGLPKVDIDISSEATYVQHDKTKLAVIRLSSSDGSSQVEVAGIKGDELLRVSCIRNSHERIPVTYGVCGDKVKEIFGNF